jgi:hypothetical protein
MDAERDGRADSPGAVYAARLCTRRARLARRARRVAALSNARLAAFSLLAVAAVAVWVDALSGPWLLLPGGAFLVLVPLHRRESSERQRAARAVAFYERGSERLEHRFLGRGVTGARFAADDHAYAAQLDLFGPGSLYELLCGAQTEAGQETLARWLLEPATPDQVRERQAAVRELTPRLDLREELAVLGTALSDPVDRSGLAEWVAEAPRAASTALRALLAVLAGLNLAALASWLLLETGPAPLVPLLLVEVPLWLRLRPRVESILTALARPAAQLDLVAALLGRLERERFATPRLAGLLTELSGSRGTASRRLRQLMLLVDLVESRRNQMFAVIAPVLLWATQLAFAIEAWRIGHAASVRRWLGAVGELEALLDLASYAWERPGDPFPELEEGGPRFVAEALGHPLIPDAECVRNDVRLDAELRLYVVSGSNMSGKSTLLRSVGINAVLGLAGAPVCARSLRLSAIAVGASLRVLDSLQDGISHFQAEILRMRLIAALAGGERPLLFLLDEIFQGTNSHDRVHGATAIVRGLVERGSIGLVSTHDLALTGIVGALGPRAANVHFEDVLVDGQMSFDYRLREGVVQRSNAVALMRAVGLEV